MSDFETGKDLAKEYTSAKTDHKQRLRDDVDFNNMEPFAGKTSSPKSLPSLGIDAGRFDEKKINEGVEAILTGKYAPPEFIVTPQDKQHDTSHDFQDWWKNDLIVSTVSALGDLMGKWQHELYGSARPAMITACREIRKQAKAAQHEYDSFMTEVEKPE